MTTRRRCRARISWPSNIDRTLRHPHADIFLPVEISEDQLIGDWVACDAAYGQLWNAAPVDGRRQLLPPLQPVGSKAALNFCMPAAKRRLSSANFHPSRHPFLTNRRRFRNDLGRRELAGNFGGEIRLRLEVGGPLSVHLLDRGDEILEFAPLTYLGFLPVPLMEKRPPLVG